MLYITKSVSIEVIINIAPIVVSGNTRNESILILLSLTAIILLFTS